jgi:hypothetical protein
MENPYSPPSAQIEEIKKDQPSIPKKLANDIRNGWIAACISGCMTLMLALISIFSDLTLSHDAWSLIDVTLTFGLAVGIFYRSRVASTITFIYFLLSKIVIYIQLGQLTGWFIITIIFFYIYGKAMIATYKVHKITSVPNT